MSTLSGFACESDQVSSGEEGGVEKQGFSEQRMAAKNSANDALISYEIHGKTAFHTFLWKFLVGSGHKTRF